MLFSGWLIVESLEDIVLTASSVQFWSFLIGRAVFKEGQSPRQDIVALSTIQVKTNAQNTSLQECSDTGLPQSHLTKW